MSEVHGASPNTAEKLVYMANQIASFFRSQPGATAAPATADHLRSFWTRNMLRDLYEHIDAVGDEGLIPVARDAVAMLRTAPAGAVRDALAAAGKPTSRAPGNDAG